MFQAIRRMMWATVTVSALVLPHGANSALIVRDLTVALSDSQIMPGNDPSLWAKVWLVSLPMPTATLDIGDSLRVTLTFENQQHLKMFTNNGGTGGTERMAALIGSASNQFTLHNFTFGFFDKNQDIITSFLTSSNSNGDGIAGIIDADVTTSIISFEGLFFQFDILSGSTGLPANFDLALFALQSSNFAVDEPATLFLLGMGLVAFLVLSHVKVSALRWQ